MKKILPLFLVVCLVVCLTVPVSAKCFSDLPFYSSIEYLGKMTHVKTMLQREDFKDWSFIVFDKYLYGVKGSLYVEDNKVKNSLDEATIYLWIYNADEQYWDDSQTHDWWSAGSNFTDVSKVLWSKNDLVNENGIVVFEGDPNFKPTYNEVMQESIDGLGANILKSVGVLLPVGLVVMGSVIVVGLLRKKKFWHV